MSISIKSIFKIFSVGSSKNKTSISCGSSPPIFLPGETIGIIAGSGILPIRCAKIASEKGLKVAAVCHLDEADPQIESYCDYTRWIKVGQLGDIISFFRERGVKHAVMAGGISRVRTFKDVSLDLKGTLLLAKIRSTKDDVIMRGVADELANEGIEIVDSTIFAADWLVSEGVLTKKRPNAEQQKDIHCGCQAIKAMTGLHIGQLVVVKAGVIVAVEAVEGSDETIRRGGVLGHTGTVVVKCAKPDQDMRFDVPVAGMKTLQIMKEVGATVLALEAGRSLIVDKEDVIKFADNNNIAIVGIDSLVDDSSESCEASV